MAMLFHLHLGKVELMIRNLLKNGPKCDFFFFCLRFITLISFVLVIW